MENKKNSIKTFFSKIPKSVIITTCVITIILGLSILSYIYLWPRFYVKKFNQTFNVEYNTKFKPNYGKVCYGNFIKCNKTNNSYSGKVNIKKLGKYNLKYTYKYNGKKMLLKQKVYVVDKTKPKLTIENKEIFVCPNGKIDNLKVSAIDNYDGDITKKVTTKFKDNKVTIKVKDSHNNISKKVLKAVIQDKTPPVITLNGSKEKTIVVGGTYQDEGATAIDNCDDNIQVQTTNELNTKVAGKYKITYKATDTSGNESIEERIITVKSVSKGSRVIYLTFDDGPSEYTPYLLDVLKKYNVKVTFFVTGKGSDDTILREYNEGHKVALHTYSHNYATVYSSTDNYFKDLYQIQDRVKRITGYTSNIIRFPGGSSNTVSKSYDGGTRIMTRLTKEVQNRGFYYFDWNISSGDAGGAITSDQVYNNVIRSLKDGSYVVLQHDTQKFSIDAVERIINYANENGYTFQTLNESSPGAHHGTNN